MHIQVEGALLTLAVENVSNQFSIAGKLSSLIAAGPDIHTHTYAYTGTYTHICIAGKLSSLIAAGPDNAAEAATNPVGIARVEAQEHSVSVGSRK